MKLLLISVLSLVIVSCAQAPAQKSAENVKRFTFGPKTLELVEYRPSVEGRYLMTGDVWTSATGKTPWMSLFTLGTNGESMILRSVESRYRRLALIELRRVEPGLYAYTACVPSNINCTSTSIHFISPEGRDVFPRPVPSESDDLNFHDFVRAKNGNFFFLFANFDFKSASVDNTIQEWDPQGRKIFNWRMDDHKTEFAKWGKFEIAHINSLDLDSDGNILMSVWQYNTVFKIAYPSGKILAAIGNPEWKFENDSYGGFNSQHGVRALPNGHILLFDNGNGLNERPSRAVEYSLDYKTKTAKLIWEYRMPDGVANHREIGGSVQRLSNGNTLIGWGVPQSLDVNRVMRIATEVDHEGRMVRELRGQQANFRISFEESGLTAQAR